MRYIQKGDTPPPSLAEFLEAQKSVGLNLDYAKGFGRKAELLQELIAEQFGLCAYTGAAIDDRLSSESPSSALASGVSMKAHVEHLKPQSVCRRELIEQGLEPGVDVGEDMDYRNLVAALLVVGHAREQYGAAAKASDEIPIWPTHPDCGRRFRFDAGGMVHGLDSDASKTIEVLRLNHESLRRARSAAIDVFMTSDILATREDVEDLLIRLDRSNSGRLVEYSFCIRDAVSNAFQ